MWIFTNGVNLGASRLIGDAVYNEIREARSYRMQKHLGDRDKINLNVVGITREDQLRYGENIGFDGSVI